MGDGRGTKKTKNIQHSDSTALQGSLKKYIIIKIRHYEIGKLHVNGPYIFKCEQIVTQAGK